MLYASIGAIWVASLLTIVFFAAYFHSLITQETAPESSAGYFWDASRTFASYCLALSLFYAGMGRQVLDLPVLIAYQLINAPLSLWPAETWFFLALFCLAASSYWLLVEINWRSGLVAVGALLALLFGGARARRERPPAAARLQPASALATSRSFDGQALLRRRSALLSTAAAVALMVVGWQVLRWADFPQTLSRVLGESPVVGLLPNQRFTPTPTPDLQAQTLGVLAGGQAAGSAPDAQPASNSAPDNPPADAPAQQNAATPIPTLPLASTPLPTPTWTPTPGPDNSPFALIKNAVGVNARAEPNLESVVTTILAPGTVAPIVEQTADGEWLRVRLESGDAWVASWVVEISQPLTQAAAPAEPAATAALQSVGPQSVTPQSVAVQPTATATSQPAQAAVPTVSSVTQSVSASSIAPDRSQNSYSVYLESPQNGFSSTDEFKFRWSATFAPAANQTFEVVIWTNGQDAMSDGVSLGRALPPSPDQPAQLTVNLAQRDLVAGPYRWGVVLIQREPYRRLALLSSDGQIIFAP